MSLESVKVGDLVLVVSDYGTQRCVCAVERVTSTTFIAGNRRFRKSTGLAIGADYGGWNARIATDEDIREQRALALFRHIAEIAGSTRHDRVFGLERARNAARQIAKSSQALCDLLAE